MKNKKKIGEKKFAGALASYSIEYLLPNGKTAQGPDAHFDGQNFAKAFDITFLDKNRKLEYAWQNTWAISTRVIGILIAAHGDDKGLIIPFCISPIQVIVVPIFDKKNKNKILKEAEEIESNSNQLLNYTNIILI